MRFNLLRHEGSLVVQIMSSGSNLSVDSLINGENYSMLEMLIERMQMNKMIVINGEDISKNSDEILEIDLSNKEVIEVHLVEYSNAGEEKYKFMPCDADYFATINAKHYENNLVRDFFDGTVVCDWEQAVYEVNGISKLLVTTYHS